MKNEMDSSPKSEIILYQRNGVVGGAVRRGNRMALAGTNVQRIVMLFLAFFSSGNRSVSL